MPLDAYQDFGAAIKEARLARGWSLETLAHEALGNSTRKGYCSQVERGKRKLSAGTIQNFARALELGEDLVRRARLAEVETDEAQETDAPTATLLEELEGLRQELKLSEALAVALAYKYTEGSPTDIKGALAGLEAAFETAAEQKAKDALPSNIDAAVDAVLTEVARLNDAGQPEDADALLMAEIEKADAELARQKAQLERYYDRAIAQAVLTRDADAYAARSLQRIKLNAPSPEDQFYALRAIQDERFETGLRIGAPFQLTAAIGLARQCEAIAPTPYLRAMAQNDQANALANQGTRTSGPKGTELLAQAVAAYDAALEVRTRAEHPVRWAMTQNNRAVALEKQGIRTSGPEGAALLAQAVGAYDDALEVRTRAEHPVRWAMTQNNKAIALAQQGIRTAGPEGAALLSQAVAAYDSALEVHTRADHPARWAMTQYNLAKTKLEWAGREGAEYPGAMLAEAIANVHGALEVFDPENTSYDYEKATQVKALIQAAMDALP